MQYGCRFKVISMLRIKQRNPFYDRKLLGLFWRSFCSKCALLYLLAWRSHKLDQIDHKLFLLIAFSIFGALAWSILWIDVVRPSSMPLDFGMHGDASTTCFLFWSVIELHKIYILLDFDILYTLMKLVLRSDVVSINFCDDRVFLVLICTASCL